MKITIEGKDFELDVQRAKDLNVIQPYHEPILAVNVGDVFIRHESCPLVVVRALYAGVYDDQTPCFAFVGLFGSLDAYSNYDRLFSRNQIKNHLNDGKYVHIGNVNDGFSKLLGDLVKKHNNES